MRRVLLLAVVLLALGASGAEGRTTIIEPLGANGTFQRWADGSLAATYQGEIEVTGDLSICRNEVVVGCAFPSGEHIVVNSSTPRFTFFHELGHAYDFRVLTPEQRNRFLWINGLSSPAWQESPDPPAVEGWPQRQSPSELFADAYAVCASVANPQFVFPDEASSYTEFGGMPRIGLEWSPRHWQFVKTCELVGRHRLPRHR